MRMRMVAGRDFTESRQEGVREAIIDRNLADTFFPPPATAIGAKIPMDDTSVVVVGVVEQARQYDVDRDGRPQVYLRAEDWGYRTLYWVMRSVSGLSTSTGGPSWGRRKGQSSIA